MVRSNQRITSISFSFHFTLKSIKQEAFIIKWKYIPIFVWWLYCVVIIKHALVDPDLNEFKKKFKTTCTLVIITKKNLRSVPWKEKLLLLPISFLSWSRQPPVVLLFLSGSFRHLTFTLSAQQENDNDKGSNATSATNCTGFYSLLNISSVSKNVTAAAASLLRWLFGAELSAHKIISCVCLFVESKNTTRNSIFKLKELSRKIEQACDFHIFHP